MPLQSITCSSAVYMADVETHEDIIVINQDIAHGLETGELEMPQYGVIRKSEKED